MMSMSSEQELQGQREVRFFGKVSALISHEIKNVLAVMAESAGLMEDLCLLNLKKGVPLEVERLNTLVDRILRQVGRADEIVKNMNRFAHSVDETVSTVDLQNHIHLLIALSRRLTTMKGVSVDFVQRERQITLDTSAFLLYSLLWSCLEFSISVCGPGKRIEVHATEMDGRVRITFAGLEHLTTWPSDAFPGAQRGVPALELSAQLMGDVERKALIIELPKRICMHGETA